jgi:heat shock protein HtpX
MNTMKTMLLMVTLTLILVFIGGLLGGKSGLTIALLMAFGLNFITYWFSDRIVLKMYRARPVGEAEAPEFYSMVNRLAQQAQLPLPRMYIIDEDQPNAFATGRNPQHGAVAVTTGLMRILSREELEGVIGHELAHIKHRDILVSTMVATIAGAITYLAQMAQWSMIFGGRRDEGEEGGGLFATMAMMIVGPIAAMLVQMAISRSREYEADAGGARIAGDPRHLSNALRKMEKAAEQIPMNASPATAQMFIVNPLSGGGLLRLFSTHPPMEQRIARLEAMRSGSILKKPKNNDSAFS